MHACCAWELQSGKPTSGLSLLQHTHVNTSTDQLFKLQSNVVHPMLDDRTTAGPALPFIQRQLGFPLTHGIRGCLPLQSVLSLADTCTIHAGDAA
jgi:hypothetical protein